MRYFALLPLMLLALLEELNAQAPQFAVVKPNGVTHIRTSWDSAYSVAVDGDFIYLPGVTITTPITIDKKLLIYGAGHHPDSTTATGRTIIANTINVLPGAGLGLIEGIYTYLIYIGGAAKLQDYTITRCNIIDLVFTSSHPDSMPEYVTITESIIKAITNSINCAPVKNIFFIKNIFIQNVSCLHACTFKNNNFLSYNAAGPCFSITNSSFENNIFLTEQPAQIAYANCNNIFLNNLKLTNNSFQESELCPASQEDNISVASINDIFMSYPSNGFSYNNNYQLLPSCPGNDAGTDGTDVGIYGTNNPTVEGWVPSNPHIFFKQVDAETGTDGKLHIQVGVRTNNN